MEPQPADPQLSIAVMSHPQRAAEARALARRLAGARVVTDPTPMGAPSPLKTAIHAWRAVAPGATHHLVVQDDVVLADGFLDRVRSGISLFPDAALTFYANWSSMTGSFIRLAACAGATWVEESAGEYFPTLAMVLPSKHIEDYLEHARHFATWWRDDDDFMREFIVSHGLDAYASVPCLVEHGELDSIAGNTGHGTRHAACFSRQPGLETSHEAVAHSIDLCPWMVTGRVQSLVRTAYRDSHVWLRRPWTDMVAPFALDPGDLRTSCDRLVSGSVRLQKASDDLGELFVFSLWLTGFLLGTVVRAGKVPVRLLAGDAAAKAAAASAAADEPLVRAGLHTIAAGASSWTLMPMPLVTTYSTEAGELAEAGFRSGLAGR